MNPDIFTSIRSHYNAFTKAEKKVAEFVLENPKQILDMSITDLAERCGVGDTSVFRFCRDLDLKGYQDFRIMIAHSLNTEEGGMLIGGAVSPEDTLEIVIQKTLQVNTQALQETYKLVDPESVKKAVDWLISAGRVSFFGAGTSYITALDAYNKFMRITPKVEAAGDSHMQAMSACMMTEQDVAVAISYSGSTKDTIDAAKAAKERGARVISLTRFIKSPLTQYSDLTLLCGATEGPFQGGSLSAKLSQLFLLDIIYQEYFRRTYDLSMKNKSLTSEAVAEKQL